MSHSEPATNERFQIACRHIRSKEMYHQPAGQEDGPCSSGLFWCTRTHENFGPDGQPVSKHECSGNRPCFAR
jgi:hypothetical protein